MTAINATLSFNESRCCSAISQEIWCITENLTIWSTACQANNEENMKTHYWSFVQKNTRWTVDYNHKCHKCKNIHIDTFKRTAVYECCCSCTVNTSKVDFTTEISKHHHVVIWSNTGKFWGIRWAPNHWSDTKYVDGMTLRKHYANTMPYHAAMASVLHIKAVHILCMNNTIPCHANAWKMAYESHDN